MGLRNLYRSLYSTATKPLDKLEAWGQWNVLHLIEKWYGKAHPNLPMYYDGKLGRYRCRDVSIRNFKKSYFWIYTKTSTLIAYVLVILRSKYLFSKLISGVERVNIIELMINVYAFALFSQVVGTVLTIEARAAGYCWVMNQLKGRGNRKRTSGIFIPFVELSLVATAIGFAIFPLGASIFPFIAPYDPASFMVHFSARHFVQPYFPEYMPPEYVLRILSSVLISCTVWPVTVPACFSVLVLLSGGCAMNELMKAAHSNITYKVRQRWAKGAKYQGKVDPEKATTPQNSSTRPISRESLNAIDQLGAVSFPTPSPEVQISIPNESNSKEKISESVHKLFTKSKWGVEEHEPAIIKTKFREGRMLYNQINLICMETNRNMALFMPATLGAGILICTIGYFSIIRLADSLPFVFIFMQFSVTIMITLIITFLIPVGATLFEEYRKYEVYWSRLIRSKQMKKELLACSKIVITVGPYMEMDYGLTIDMMYAILDKTFLLIML
ncbi:unnamed protein product [Orchesella dallaii]|uniref:Odorant receptor n=1 Tax=Orchesella dallaii TaxID=48710 RepID=A0ABP1RBS7_9HEXA